MRYLLFPYRKGKGNNTMASQIDVKKWFAEERCKQVVDILQKNRFNAMYVVNKEDALKRIEADAGTIFDPMLVEKFVGLIDTYIEIL